MILVSPAYCEQVSLDETLFMAKGLNETLLRVASPGQYRLQTKSDQGTQLTLVDRMVGPTHVSGVMGQSDARLDVLLDEGVYKVRLQSHQEGVGQVELSVFTFKETQAKKQIPDFPVLEWPSTYAGKLEDLQQKSFWFHLENRDVIRWEAMGRNLKNCRLWLDGNWLIAEQATSSSYEPIEGQPMTYLEFNQQINPGLYLLTCYGGEALPWTEQTDRHLFFVRTGVSSLGDSGRQTWTISPFGRDVFRLPKETNFFQLIREDKKETTLSTGTWTEYGTRHKEENPCKITKESRDPWCVIQSASGYEKQVVSIRGEPGDEVLLDYFVSKNEKFALPRQTQEYWISSLHSTEGNDAIDVTGLIMSFYDKKPIISQFLSLGRGKPLVRKINLLGEDEVYIQVEDSGTYTLLEDPAQGASVQYQLEPLMFYERTDYRAPLQKPGDEVELIQGIYVLKLHPVSKGILSFTLRKKEKFELHTFTEKMVSTIHDVLGTQVETYGNLLWPAVTISGSDRPHELWMNRRYGVTSGIIMRPLPLNLETPLPITLATGQQVPIKIHIHQRSRIEVSHKQNAKYSLSQNGASLSRSSFLPQGPYTLTLKNTGETSGLFTIQAMPFVSTKKLSPKHLDHLQQVSGSFPVLKEQKPVFVNFERHENKHFTVLVEEAGLYRIETSGRLATQLTVRNRMTTSLFNASLNGIGRNALVQQYLKPGEYQVTVQTQGQSKGRAGIHLRRTALDTDKTLLVDGVQRVSLEPDAAVRYHFEITEKGNYQIQTSGLGKTFGFRLDDAEGWPLVSPGNQVSIQQELGPGSYFYYSLPSFLESRRSTKLSQIKSPAELVGKGPHVLPINATRSHLWRETPGRIPDVYTLNIPANVLATGTLSKGMELFLFRKGEGLIETIYGPSGWEGELKTGEYEAQVKSIETNDLFPYTLGFQTKQLISGITQKIHSLPALLKVSVGTTSFVDIASEGGTDVKAVLCNEQGTRILGWNDDAKDDWNFHLSQRLKPGLYTLRVMSVGQKRGSVGVKMRTREEVSLQEHFLPFTVEERLGEKVWTVPFQSKNKESLIHLKASDPDIGMTLLTQDRVVAQEKGEMFIPLKSDDLYHLQFWHLNSSSEPITITAKLLPFIKSALSSSQTKLDIPPKEHTTIVLSSAENISYHLSENLKSWFCTAEHSSCHPLENTPFSLNQGKGWLIVKGGISEEQITLTPFELSLQKVTMVELGQTPLAFNINVSKSAPLLLEATSVGGMLGGMISSQKAASSFSRSFHWFGSESQPAKTIMGIPTKGQYWGRIWKTKKSSNPEKVFFKFHVFDPQAQKELPFMSTVEGVLQSGQSQSYALSQKTGTLELSMTKGMVAFVWSQEQTETLISAMEGNVQETVDVSGGLLIFTNQGNQEALFHLTPGTKKNTLPAFDNRKGFEATFSEPGKFYLFLQEIQTGHHLFVDGDHVSSRFFDAEGVLRSGTQFEIKTPSEQNQGMLEVTHDTGFVQVWQGPVPQKERLRMGSHENVEESPLLETGELKHETQLWKITLKHPGYLIVETNAPGATALLDKQMVLKTALSGFSTQRRLSYFLDSGEYQLWTRPIEGTKQTGTIEIQKLAPVLLHEGLSEKISLIRSGVPHVYQFEVYAKAKIGIGVRTEQDQLKGELYDSKFQWIAQGPLIFRELEPGKYIYVVSLSTPSSPPVQYKPVLWGTQGSESGVPEEVMKQYQREGLAIRDEILLGDHGNTRTESDRASNNTENPASVCQF
ncbi:hypothetical protein WDW89_22260 [Deltaproteobacteria bacterium TL4]